MAIFIEHLRVKLDHSLCVVSFRLGIELVSLIGEFQKSLGHLDKAGFISGIGKTFRKRPALGGIPTIFACRRHARRALPKSNI